jgi:hypothetical protein
MFQPFVPTVMSWLQEYKQACYLYTLFPTGCILCNEKPFYNEYITLIILRWISNSYLVEDTTDTISFHYEQSDSNCEKQFWSQIWKKTFWSMANIGDKHEMRKKFVQPLRKRAGISWPFCKKLMIDDKP